MRVPIFILLSKNVARAAVAKASAADKETLSVHAQQTTKKTGHRTAFQSAPLADCQKAERKERKKGDKRWQNKNEE
jgi:hypothetical protein